MTDEAREYKKDKVVNFYINSHARTKCGWKSKRWYIRAIKEHGKIKGICSKCGMVVEEYFTRKAP